MAASTEYVKLFYERDAKRFWDPKRGLTGRDLVVYPFLSDVSGVVLEYGCGSGSLLLNIAKEERFTKCIGVDISESALSAVAESWRHMCEDSHYPRDKVELVSPEDDRLPKIESESVDVLLALAVLEHVLDPYTVLDELYRVAKPGAILVACVPNYGYVKHICQLLLNIQPRTGGDSPIQQWRYTGWDGMHLHTFVQSSFELLLKD